MIVLLFLRRIYVDLQMPLGDIQSCRRANPYISGLRPGAVIIQAKIDSAPLQIIPFVMDAEAFVEVVNAAMKKERNKKEEN